MNPRPSGYEPAGHNGRQSFGLTPRRQAYVPRHPNNFPCGKLARLAHSASSERSFLGAVTAPRMVTPTPRRVALSKRPIGGDLASCLERFMRNSAWGFSDLIPRFSAEMLTAVPPPFLKTFWTPLGHPQPNHRRWLAIFFSIWSAERRGAYHCPSRTAPRGWARWRCDVGFDSLRRSLWRIKRLEPAPSPQLAIHSQRADRGHAIVATKVAPSLERLRALENE